MARTGCSLKSAASELGKSNVSVDECNSILKRASFQRSLWESRHRYFSDLGANPSFKKDTMIGRMINLAQKLEEEGKYDSAAEVLFKVAKAQGWTGPESTVNVFGDLSQKDIDAIRTKLSKAMQPKAN